VLGTGDKLPGSTEYSDPRAVRTKGRIHAIYMKLIPERRRYGLFHASRGSGDWSSAQLVSGEDLMQLDVMLTANRRGTVVAAWNKSGKAPGYRVKRAGARRFGRVRRLPVGRADHLDAIALDRDGDLHAIVTGRGLRYMTNASGRWRASRIPDSRCRILVDNACIRPSLLTYDAASDRVVVVEQHAEIRIASKPADARRFGRLHPVRAANRRDLVATSVTRSGRRTTLGLGSFASGQDRTLGRASGPFHVWSGGRLTRVPETGDGEFHVAAAGRNRVQLAWRRGSPSWDRDEQGIWTAQLAGSKVRGVRHRTDSAYDRLTSLTTDGRGRALLAYRR
jgi:hypothetical protein